MPNQTHEVTAPAPLEVVIGPHLTTAISSADAVKATSIRDTLLDLEKQESDHNRATVHKRLDALRDQYAANPTAENQALLTAASTEESLASSRTAHVEASRARKAFQEGTVFPFQREIGNRLHVLIQKDISVLDAAERAAAKRFGVDFKPSATLAALRETAVRVELNGVSFKFAL